MNRRYKLKLPTCQSAIGSRYYRAVTCLLEIQIRIVSGSQYRIRRMYFVGTGNLPGSCQSYGMIIFRSAFGCYQIIPTVAFEEYGTFRNSQCSAGEDVINLSDKPVLPGNWEKVLP